MALITLSNAQLAFGHVALLDHADFSLEPNERVGLIGRNGAGKSSLLRILEGTRQPDDGTRQIQRGVRLAFVAQEPSLDPDHSVFACVSEGLAPVIALRERYFSASHADDLDALQTQIEAYEGWNWEQRVEETLERLHLDGEAQVGDLSGGKKKRVALAQALVTRPDVLLLDEPTNHLDLDSIEWLEELLRDFKGSIVTITHDRSFLDRVATRIVELDRGRLLSYPGNFARYLEQKAEQLAQERIVSAKADRLLAQEEIWIRKGVEARRTRSQSRITRLEALRADRSSRRGVMGNVKLDISSGAQSGKFVSEMVDVNKSYGTTRVVRDFSATILRGDKVGLLGPNGAGKTTLLKLILGEISPDSGSVRQGSKMQVAYFDQMREGVDLDATLEDFISPGSEWIEIGQERKHVKSYLGDFLFSPARARSPVRSLSGGERNRLFLARLFARPANVLVLDEPTNDLDIETLDLLEELLQNYDGTVFLVSHDRTFLDNVVTSTIAFEGDGAWREYEGGVRDWLIQSARAKELAKASGDATKTSLEKSSKEIGSCRPVAQETSLSKRKLSYKDQRELDSLPSLIATLEAEQQGLQAELADGSLYQNDASRAIALQARDAEIEDALMTALGRWEALSA